MEVKEYEEVYCVFTIQNIPIKLPQTTLDFLEKYGIYNTKCSY